MLNVLQRGKLYEILNKEKTALGVGGDALMSLIARYMCNYNLGQEKTKVREWILHIGLFQR